MNEKPAADTNLNGSRLDIAEFFRVVHCLVETWTVTEASVRSTASLAFSFARAVCGESLHGLNPEYTFQEHHVLRNVRTESTALLKNASKTLKAHAVEIIARHVFDGRPTIRRN